MSVRLVDIYDADRHHYDTECRNLRSWYLIPHPLRGVRYGDGEIPDTTAGKIYTPKPAYGGYKR